MDPLARDPYESTGYRPLWIHWLQTPMDPLATDPMDPLLSPVSCVRHFEGQAPGSGKTAVPNLRRHVDP